MRSIVAAAIFVATLLPCSAYAEDVEFSLFEPSGKPVAYLAPAEDMTFYLWSGEPVAYLDNEGEEGPYVYGFNGQHLGWFVNGVIFDRNGLIACASNEILTRTDYEPYKSYKKYKPYKKYKSRPPRKPDLKMKSSPLGCALLLASGQG